MQARDITWTRSPASTLKRAGRPATGATGHLPQPVGALAYELGIGPPSDPRSAVSGQVAELRNALRHHDYAKANALGRTLKHNASQLTSDERAELSMLHDDGSAPEPPSDTSPTAEPATGQGTPPSTEPAATSASTMPPETAPTTLSPAGP